MNVNPTINIEHHDEGFETRVTFHNWTIGSGIFHARKSDAIMNLHRDIDKIAVLVFKHLHDWGDEYVSQEWERLNDTPNHR